jgi:hypothetical protein
MQHGAQRLWLTGQDDGEFVAVELPGFGQDLVEAAEQVQAVVRQSMPGMRSGDHHQVTSDPDRLAYLFHGIPGGDTDQVDGGDLDQVAVLQ